MKKTRRLAHKVFQAATRSEWDVWRKHYDTLSINDLIFINMGIDGYIRDQECLTTGDVIEVLEELYLATGSDFNVVELGCYKGYMADAVLEHFPKAIKSWVGYDVNYYALEETACKDGRYSTVKQTEWFYDVEFFNDPNLFVTTSTLEHHNRDQFFKILEKMKKTQSIRHMIIGLPIKEVGWQGYGGSHVLEMNSEEEIAQVIEDVGFEIFFYKKRKIHMWGASR